MTGIEIRHHCSIPTTQTCRRESSDKRTGLNLCIAACVICGCCVEYRGGVPACTCIMACTCTMVCTKCCGRIEHRGGIPGSRSGPRSAGGPACIKKGRPGCCIGHF